MIRTFTRTLAIVALLGAVFAATGCSASAGSGGSTSGSTSSAGAIEEWPAAEAAIKKVDKNAVLLMAGTRGLATADSPSALGFTFFMPSLGHVYGVEVGAGGALEPTDLGEVNAGSTAVLDAADVKVAPAEAIAKAREFGSKSGTLPEKAMVSGAFTDLPAAEKTGLLPGVWHVTFASAEDLSDAKKYLVDMTTGEVSLATK